MTVFRCTFLSFRPSVLFHPPLQGFTDITSTLIMKLPSKRDFCPFEMMAKMDFYSSLSFPFRTFNPNRFFSCKRLPFPPPFRASIVPISPFGPNLPKTRRKFVLYDLPARPFSPMNNPVMAGPVSFFHHFSPPPLPNRTRPSLPSSKGPALAFSDPSDSLPSVLGFSFLGQFINFPR